MIDWNTIPDFYKGYVEHVKHSEVLQALQHSGKITIEMIRSIPEEKSEYRYAPGKWSINEVLCHLMDAERIFSYRALRFARNDKTPLSGFDENQYAPEANAHGRSILQLADEMKNLRTTSIDLFNSFTTEMLQRTGTSGNNVVSVKAWGYIIAGHETHHRKILQERYLG